MIVILDFRSHHTTHSGPKTILRSRAANLFNNAGPIFGPESRSLPILTFCNESATGYPENCSRIDTGSHRLASGKDYQSYLIENLFQQGLLAILISSRPTKSLIVSLIK